MRATPISGSKKFGDNSPWHKTKLPLLSAAENAQINWLSGHSLAKKTWSSYSTAERLLRECCKAKNIPCTLPVSHNTVVSFVLWLAFERKVSSASISIYLAGIRQLHIQLGCACPDIRSDFVKMLLQGKKNSEFCADSDRNGDKRKPITPALLLRMKQWLTDSKLEMGDKRMVWAACTILFFGAFRASEVLVTDALTFDPRFTLCAEDITLSKNTDRSSTLSANIKIPKEVKNGENQLVTIHEASDKRLCPVLAWEKWQAYQPPTEKGQPAFRWLSGLPFSTRQLNNTLKDALHPDSTGYSTHSFRIGAASTMSQLGFSDDDIRSIGRWKSTAYNSYIRTEKRRRRTVAKKFSEHI